MYQAKRRGGARHQVIDLREALRVTEMDSLERDQREAFAQDRLDVAYQPIVRSADGTVVGLEALLRWTHLERGSSRPCRWWAWPRRSVSSASSARGS
jgi:predicted signal transduction protein with EAL and GGDEF domain